MIFYKVLLFFLIVFFVKFHDLRASSDFGQKNLQNPQESLQGIEQLKDRIRQQKQSLENITLQIAAYQNQLQNLQIQNDQQKELDRQYRAYEQQYLSAQKDFDIAQLSLKTAEDTYRNAENTIKFTQNAINSTPKESTTQQTLDLANAKASLIKAKELYELEKASLSDKMNALNASSQMLGQIKKKQSDLPKDLPTQISTTQKGLSDLLETRLRLQNFILQDESQLMLIQHQTYPKIEQTQNPLMTQASVLPSSTAFEKPVIEPTKFSASINEKPVENKPTVSENVDLSRPNQPTIQVISQKKTVENPKLFPTTFVFSDQLESPNKIKRQPKRFLNTYPLLKEQQQSVILINSSQPIQDAKEKLGDYTIINPMINTTLVKTLEKRKLMDVLSLKASIIPLDNSGSITQNISPVAPTMTIIDPSNKTDLSQTTLQDQQEIIVGVITFATSTQRT